MEPVTDDEAVSSGVGATVVTKPDLATISQVDEESLLLKRCPTVRNMKDFGWSSGNKTNFCKDLGFTGVITTGGYGEGNFCYEGDIESCKERLRKGI